MDLRSEYLAGHKIASRVGGVSLAEILQDYLSVINMSAFAFFGYNFFITCIFHTIFSFPVNEKNEKAYSVWTNSPPNICFPGDVSSNLKHLLSESTHLLSYDPPKSTTACVNQTRVPRITILSPKSSNSKRIKIISTSIKSLAAKPMVATVTNPEPPQSSANSSSSRRKPQSRCISFYF